LEVIEAVELTKVFNGLKAVDSVSFSVRKGEIFGFLGPNGAGKTTTINMLTTIMKPTRGFARVAGFDVVKEADEVRKRIGVLFQDVTLDRELTGWENMWFHGLIHGISWRELRDRISELLKFIELENWKSVQVKKYSGGMLRRLQLAAALVHEPEILFLDEPTLGLDPQTRARVWDYILGLRKERGVTIFLTTHYMDEAEKLCDRVAIIDKGKIIACGSPRDLKQQVGNDVVYLRVSSKADLLINLLIKEGLASQPKLIGSDTVSFTVRNAHETLPQAVSLAEKAGIRVVEAFYSEPTLEDVFLNLTGRGLRDEEASDFEFFRARMRGRFR